MKSDTAVRLMSLLNCVQPSPIIGYTARKIAKSIISLIIVTIIAQFPDQSTRVGLARMLDFIDFYSRVLRNPTPSIPI
jgi:hypothetical protein